jgi:hypothetical protein
MAFGDLLSEQSMIGTTRARRQPGLAGKLAEANTKNDLIFGLPLDS